ncbi:hypothetical protein ADUPG1_012366 [Aduncisulcus paluster]|uniref:Uncharacterized protein n=1 Tax=Aduncisulcus paluster TaxID=2918883 RepID=A0ABQ5K2J0_9EUKA|nr:hypothetical protein ADUPG1_012366 [Aduncisulcus paluster]
MALSGSDVDEGMRSLDKFKAYSMFSVFRGKGAKEEFVKLYQCKEPHIMTSEIPIAPHSSPIVGGHANPFLPFSEFKSPKYSTMLERKGSYYSANAIPFSGILSSHSLIASDELEASMYKFPLVRQSHVSVRYNEIGISGYPLSIASVVTSPHSLDLLKPLLSSCEEKLKVGAYMAHYEKWRVTRDDVWDGLMKLRQLEADYRAFAEKVK